jgi:hypothetical protein
MHVCDFQLDLQDVSCDKDYYPMSYHGSPDGNNVRNPKRNNDRLGTHSKNTWTISSRCKVA